MTSQHDRDSRELRELCAQRDAARATVRQQATPGWSYAQVRVVDENTVDIGRVVAFADEGATPEPVGEPVYQIRLVDGAWMDLAKHVYEEKVNLGHLTVRVLYTRPAPGVPEVPQEWFHLLAEARNAAYDEEGYVMEPDLASAVEDIDAALAAAQAKGSDK